MSNKESEDEIQDDEMGSPGPEQDEDDVKYGELNVSGQDSVAAGVAAGNIHLQSANAATLALPEVCRIEAPENSIAPIRKEFEHLKLILLKYCNFQKLINAQSVL